MIPKKLFNWNSIRWGQLSKIPSSITNWWWKYFCSQDIWWKCCHNWVVLYNAVLSRTFARHINIEICSSIKAIQYICSCTSIKGLTRQLFHVTRFNLFKMADISVRQNLHVAFSAFLYTIVIHLFFNCQFI